MHIHIKQNGECIKDISEQYGVCEENIRMVNGITEGEPADGEELLILIPTRSYTVQYGDTPDRIALRFGIRRSDIYSLNPWIEKSELKQVLMESLEILTDKEKKVILFYYYEELTLKEISSILEVSESRISQLHTRALQKMKGKMGKYMGIFS